MYPYCIFIYICNRCLLHYRQEKVHRKPKMEGFAVAVPVMPVVVLLKRHEHHLIWKLCWAPVLINTKNMKPLHNMGVKTNIVLAVYDNTELKISCHVITEILLKVVQNADNRDITEIVKFGSEKN